MKQAIRMILLPFLILLIPSIGFSEVDVYFNQDDRSQYVDPYRGVLRPGHNFEQIILDEIEKASESVEIAVQEFRIPSIAQALVHKKRQGVMVRVVIDNSYNNLIPERLEQLDREQTWLGAGGDIDKGMSQIFEEDFEKSLFEKEDLDLLLANAGENKSLNPYSKEEILSNSDAIYIMRKNNIPLIDDTADGSSGTGLMHHKFVVIDGKKLVVTSANFTLSDFHGSDRSAQRIGNANALLVIDNADMAQIFLEEFNLMFGSIDASPTTPSDHHFGLRKPYRGPQKTQLGPSTQSKVQFAPTSQARPEQDSTSGLIQRKLQSAESSIEAALFVFTDQAISDQIKEMKERNNVNLSVLVDRLFAYRYYSKAMDILGLRLLSPRCAYQDGANPWDRPAQRVGTAQLNGDKLHHKFAVVDEQTVIFGSKNWTNSGNHQNDETLLVLEGEKIASEFSKEVERLQRVAQWGALPWVYDRITERRRLCGYID